MKHPTTNIQHRTPNVRRAAALGFTGCWMFDVGCSMFS
jgi:hypothetical protein